MTHGDTAKGVKCPACKKVCVGFRLPCQGDIAEYVEPCQHCGVSIRFWLRWLIVVDAEKDSRCQ